MEPRQIFISSIHFHELVPPWGIHRENVPMIHYMGTWESKNL